MQVEYIVIFKKKAPSISSIKSLKNLLSTYDDFTIAGNKLTFESQSYDISISTGEVQAKEQIYFDLIISHKTGKARDNFLELLKIVRSLVINAGGVITPVDDEISLSINTDLYPLIFNIENKLRKLISKFMLLNIGVEWDEETIPVELKNVKKTSKHESFLHQTDFIHLGDYLFKSYSKIDYLKELQSYAKPNSSKKLTASELRKLLPQSNWDRYFKKIIQTEDKKLEKSWRRLYEIRCMVAHNNFTSKMEFEEAKMLIDELDKVFEDALTKIDKITIPDSERRIVIENLLSSISEKRVYSLSYGSNLSVAF